MFAYVYVIGVYEIVVVVVSPVDVVDELFHAGCASNWGGLRIQVSQVFQDIHDYLIALHDQVSLNLLLVVV